MFVEMVQRRNVQTRILPHRQELLEQARDKLLAVWRSGYRCEQLTVRPMPLGWAQGIAEQAAEHLVSRQAPWRSEPASEKQLATLRKFRIGHRLDVTKGEASDLLQVAFAKIGPTYSAGPKEGAVAS